MQLAWASTSFYLNVYFFNNFKIAYQQHEDLSFNQIEICWTF